jgi:hypothetical protein
MLASLEQKRCDAISVILTPPAHGAWQSLIPNRSCVPMIVSSLSLRRAPLCRKIRRGSYFKSKVLPLSADILLISE